MHRRRILSLSGALAAAALAGCTAERTATGDPTTGTDTPPGDTTGRTTAGGTTDATTDDHTTADDTTAGESPTPRDVDERRLEALAADNAAFALDLHRQLATAGGGGNQFVSPYSVSVALAMTFAGARGRTREEMRETLHYALGGELHPAFADMRAVLESRATAEVVGEDDPVDAVRLSVANALWGREGFPFAEDFLSTLSTHYGAGLRRADFAGDPEGARERINEWVADATGGRIEDLLPRGAVTPNTALVVANAIHFLAAWRHEFDPERTEEGTFTALDGSTSTVPLMRQELRTTHAALGDVEAVELPYVGDEVSMVLLLPAEGSFESFEQSLGADRLFDVFEALSDARGTVVLPKFEFRTRAQLSGALSEMGMPTAFGGGADFSGMVEGGNGGLAIDEVFHEAFVSVDEEGTEAAAATAATVVDSVPPEFDTLRFDRPFLFCVRDRPTNAVLFLGRMTDAGAARPE